MIFFMSDEQKSRADFVKFWEAEILPNLAAQFFLIEKSDEIKNLCYLTWIEAAKKSVDK